MISERYSFWSLLLNKSLMKNFIFSVVFLYEWSIFFSELVFQTLRWFQTIAENFKKNKQAWVGAREHNIKYNFCPNFDHNFFFFCFFFEVLVLLDLDVPSWNLVQYQGKLMNQPLKNDKKNLIFGTILAHLGRIWDPKDFFQVLPLLVVRHCSKLSSYAI